MAEIIPSDLIGGWRLVRWEIRYDDGRDNSYPYGPDAEGLIQYTPDGYMSATICRAGRTPLSSASVKHAPEPERAEAFDGYFQYAGTWRIEGAHVIHFVSLSLNPAFVGTEQVRLMELTDGQLTLSATDTMPKSGVGRKHCLIWQKTVH